MIQFTDPLPARSFLSPAFRTGDLLLQYLSALMRPLLWLLMALVVSACALKTPETSAPRPETIHSEDLRLAQATAKAGDYATAAHLFEKVLAKQPESVPALIGAGDVYGRMGQNSRAESVLSRAHELAPNNVEALTILGRVKLAQGQYPAALDTYNKGLRIDRRNIPALTGKGVTLDAMSRHADAQAVYREGLSAYPTNFILRSNYALSLAISGDMAQGTAILRELVRDPNAAPHVRGNLALVYGLAGRDNDARATLASDLSDAQIEDNLTIYRALRRMMLEDKPIGALVFV
ncbi:tetratricopeptide repeat protein [Tritonibacter mobilis]|uniref:tetratricopeptide repeat protein n=1 Tax=Tritonibacter mobilis TaxID=379347 RepID=UPI001D0DA72F|nr:tetratricopeptide repeat protein [Tritonibacter mobilis]